MRIAIPRLLWACPLITALAACGGGAADPEPEASPLGESSESAAGRSAPLAAPSTSQRSSAATATAESADNACKQVRPFYWEIGTADGRLASGSAGSSRDGAAVDAQTPMAYASASKWLYAAYVAQVRGGQLKAIDIEMLTLRSGYTHFGACEQGQTVDACLALGSNGAYDASTDGVFVYGGGHMQKHASVIGLGAMDNAGLAARLQSRLGGRVTIGFERPQPAGGAVGTPQAYGRFLRRMLAGKLELGRLLGRESVCADPSACGRDVAQRSPAPVDETWRYSLGHWVESDPQVGDGAFSSPGALGFYPWIDASRTHYGLVARSRHTPDAALESAACGRLIRQAWVTGKAR